MSADRIMTQYEDQPGTTYIGQRPAVAILPDGRRIRLGYRVTGSYWHENDVRGVVIGWSPERFVVDAGGSSSIELRPQDILTIEEFR